MIILLFSLFFFFSRLLCARSFSLSFVIIASFDRSIAYIIFFFLVHSLLNIVFLFKFSGSQIRMKYACFYVILMCMFVCANGTCLKWKLILLCATTTAMTTTCIGTKKTYTQPTDINKRWKTMHRPDEKKKLYKYSIAVLMRLGLEPFHFF